MSLAYETKLIDVHLQKMWPLSGGSGGMGLTLVYMLKSNDFWTHFKYFMLHAPPPLICRYYPIFSLENVIYFCCSQWRIQDFPEKGAPIHYLAKCLPKMHENERNWGCVCSSPLRSATGSDILYCVPQKFWIRYDSSPVILQLLQTILKFRILLRVF